MAAVEIAFRVQRGGIPPDDLRDRATRHLDIAGFERAQNVPTT